VLSALQDLQVDIEGGTVQVPNGSSFNVVLLQAATDNDHLDPTDIYGKVSRIDNLRLLLTTSTLDKALGTWYPLAGKLANLFHGAPEALGQAGPTPATCAAGVFGMPARIPVNPGFTASGLSGVPGRFVVADLSPVHQYRVDQNAWPNTGFSGSHSDISFDEVYQLISGFFYKVN